MVYAVIKTTVRGKGSFGLVRFFRILTFRLSRLDFASLVGSGSKPNRPHAPVWVGVGFQYGLASVAGRDLRHLPRRAFSRSMYASRLMLLPSENWG